MENDLILQPKNVVFSYDQDEEPAPETAGQKEVSYEDFKEESKKYTPKHHTKAVLKTTTEGGNGSVNETFALEIQEVDMHPYVKQKIK